MLRLFVAIALPSDVREELRRLMGGVPGARWTALEDLHLTLRFIGEVDEGAAADVDDALTRVALTPFEMALSGVGVFGAGRKMRALWAGGASCPPLDIVQGRVEAAVRRAGLPAETRKFIPHVTLARLNGGDPERIGRFLEAHGLFRTGPFAVAGFSLMQSRVGRHGAAYDELRRYVGDPSATDWTQAANAG